MRPGTQGKTLARSGAEEKRVWVARNLRRGSGFHRRSIPSRCATAGDGGELLKAPRPGPAKGWAFCLSRPLSRPCRAFEDEVQARLAQLLVAVARKQRRQVDLPLAAALLEDEERRAQRLGGVAEEGLEDDVLGALDVELDRIDPRESLLLPEVEQRRRRHPHRVLVAGADDLDARFAAVPRIHEHGEVAGLVGDRAGDRLDGAERVLAD